MATEADIEKLQASIDQCVLKVKFSDREITYRSADEMERALAKMINRVRGRPEPKAWTPTFDKGYQ